MSNKLENSKSPYLLQHADNPIDWFPWGNEAFEKAATEDKPIFLSIGYSACHWCHAMAEESFSDPKTAELVNKYFVPVKVDREERPDVDTVYMNVCQTITGSGGWPLNLFLTPKGQPFFAGTYYPKDERNGMMSFKTLVGNAAEAWNDRKDEIIDTAEKITDAVNQEYTELYKSTISKEAPDNCANILESEYDNEYGGFSEAPKFPMAPALLFLLSYGKKYASAQSRKMAEKTLQKIHDGGIHDHVGGGYFRYATDREWRIPHFEKMLYDNALLAICFFEAGGNYNSYGTDILDFMSRDMQAPGGGFYSAISATSPDGEGAYYLWSQNEIKNILNRDYKAFCQTFNINENSLPYIENESAMDYQKQLESILEYRNSVRTSPDKDTKILTGWNALAAAAYAAGYKKTNDQKYLDTANSIISFIDMNLRTSDGRLLARYFENTGGINAFSEDYAYLMWAFLKLYDATNDSSYLTRAQEAWADILKYFWDERGGAYFYAFDSESLISRPMEGYDASTPSANGVIALCLSLLFKATGDVNYQNDLNKLFFAFGEQINKYPAAFCFMLYGKLSTE